MTLDDLELFFGETTPSGTRVYARLPDEGLPPGSRLAGHLMGPHSQFAHTLPAEYRFVDAGPGSGILAHAVIPEACPWTPDGPYLYDAALELVGPEGRLAETHRTLGIRPLGVRQTSLRLDGKRYVPRVADVQHVSHIDWPAWRKMGLVALTRGAEDAQLEAATQHGVLVMARVDGSPGEIANELKRLSRWPAVGIALLEGDAAAHMDRAPFAGNLVLGQVVASGECVQPAPWADLLVWSISDDDNREANNNEIGISELSNSQRDNRQAPPLQRTPQAGRTSGAGDAPRPLLVWRPSTSREATSWDDVPSARAACDRLQREMAQVPVASGPGETPPRGDFAGFIV
jgi:hypothetical protein